MRSEAMLERRYRLLLRLYPQDHRREYQEEMIGVLLAGAPPGRRSPGRREVLDLAVAALTLRWLRGARGLRDESWRQAARAVQLFGTILLLAVSSRWIVMGEVAVLRYPDRVAHWTAQELARPAAWVLVLVLILAGWRRAAVPAALAAVVAEAVPPLGLYLDTPARLLTGYWIIVAAAVVATMTLIIALDPGRPPGRRLPRGSTLVALAGVLINLAGASTVELNSTGRGLMLGGRFVSLPAVSIYAAAGLLVLLGVSRLPGPVVRRMIVTAVPVVVAWPLVQVGFGGLIEHNVRSLQPDLLGPVQWSALVLVPLAATGVAATLRRRFERGPAGPQSGGERPGSPPE